MPNSAKALKESKTNRVEDFIAVGRLHFAATKTGLFRDCAGDVWGCKESMNHKHEARKVSP